jgi:hypothetical protein
MALSYMVVDVWCGSSALTLELSEESPLVTLAWQFEGTLARQSTMAAEVLGATTGYHVHGLYYMMAHMLFSVRPGKVVVFMQARYFRDDVAYRSRNGIVLNICLFVLGKERQL